MMKERPEETAIKAIDVKPYRWALWCSVGGSEPFLNDIVCRKWSEDGEEIVFMLDSHNYLSSKPDDELNLVPIEPCASLAEEWDRRDEEKMLQRPRPTKEKEILEATKKLLVLSDQWGYRGPRTQEAIDLLKNMIDEKEKYEQHRDR